MHDFSALFGARMSDEASRGWLTKRAAKRMYARARMCIEMKKRPRLGREMYVRVDRYLGVLSPTLLIIG